MNLLVSLSVFVVGAASAAGCSSNDDCSLNGICSAGSCVCDSGWTGASCGSLKLTQPVSVAYGQPANGVQPQISSWGGSVHLLNGTYHAWIAEIVGGCGMRDWMTHSRCIHATSAMPGGPFIFSDEAMSTTCHNPVVVPADGGFYLFHIGNGTTANPGPCTTSGDSPHGPPQGSGMLFATSPYGPWRRPKAQPPACNNPGPLRLQNGTWLLACKAPTTLVYAAPSAAEGPWRAIGSLPPDGDGVRNEDAFLWEDARGGIHALRHAYQYNPAPPAPATCAGDLVSSHAWSADGGATWAAGSEPPYGNEVVEGSSGESMVVSTRERPKLLFDPASGSPLYLYNGVSSLPTCYNSTCVDCKWDATSWTFTMAAPIDITP